MMNSFGDILKNKSFTSPVMRTVQASVVLEVAGQALEQFFGKAMAEYVQPAYFKNRTLTFACLSASAAQELRFKERDILAYIKEKIPNVLLDKIRYLS